MSTKPRGSYTNLFLSAALLVVVHITRDMHVLGHNEPAAHHLVEHGQQAIDLFGSIHDLDLLRQVVG